MKLFALNSSKPFGEQVAKETGVALSEHEETVFDDGEHACRPLVNVRSEEVYIIQSLYADDVLSINDKLCRLMFFAGALKDASAKKVIAIVPYLCYARKDQKSELRGPVTTRYIAALFEVAGIDHVVTMDVHDIPAYQNAFRCPTENLEAKKLFVNFFADKYATADMVVMSPDIGGIKRAEFFQKSLNKRLGKEFPLVFKEKYRREGKVTGEALVGDVERKTVVIIDDMISTGTTVAKSVVACKNAGAKNVIVAVTHGIFCGNADALLENAGIDEIIITNTIPPVHLEHTSLMKKITVLDVAPLFGKAIKQMNEGGSVSLLLQD